MFSFIPSIVFKTLHILQFVRIGVEALPSRQFFMSTDVFEKLCMCVYECVCDCQHAMEWIAQFGDGGTRNGTMFHWTLHLYRQWDFHALLLIY